MKTLLVLVVALGAAGTFTAAASAEEKDDVSQAVAVIEAAEKAKDAKADDVGPDKAPVPDPAEPQKETTEPDDATADKPGPRRAHPLNVEAGMIIYEGDTFTCTDNVVITYGPSRIECDKMVGTLGEVEKVDEKTGEKVRQKTITHLVATGSPVTMASDKLRARCLEATYDFAEGTIVLTGSEEELPEVTTEKGMSKGKRIKFIIKGNTVDFKIEGGEITFPVEEGIVPVLPE